MGGNVQGRRRCQREIMRETPKKLEIHPAREVEERKTPVSHSYPHRARRRI